MKRKNFLRLLVLMLVIGLGLTSCSTTSSKTVSTLTGGVNRQAGSFETIITPAKDFTTLGLVFAEATKNANDDGVRGDVLVFQALLKEAQKLKGDYIINVVIDKRIETTQSTSTMSSPFGEDSSESSYTATETWYGSAIAIKYTTSLTVKEERQITSGGQTTTTTTTNPVMNDPKQDGSGSGNIGSGALSIGIPSVGSSKTQTAKPAKPASAPSVSKNAGKAKNCISADITIAGGGIRYERVIADWFSVSATAYYNNLFSLMPTVGGFNLNARFYPFKGTFYIELGLIGFGEASYWDEYEVYDPYYGSNYEYGTKTSGGYMLEPAIGWKIDVGAADKFFINPFLSVPMVIGVPPSIRLGMGIGYAF